MFFNYLKFMLTATKLDPILNINMSVSNFINKTDILEIPREAKFHQYSMIITKFYIEIVKQNEQLILFELKDYINENLQIKKSLFNKISFYFENKNRGILNVIFIANVPRMLQFINSTFQNIENMIIILNPIYNLVQDSEKNLKESKAMYLDEYFKKQILGITMQENIYFQYKISTNLKDIIICKKMIDFNHQQIYSKLIIEKNNEILESINLNIIEKYKTKLLLCKDFLLHNIDFCFSFLFYNFTNLNGKLFSEQQIISGDRIFIMENNIFLKNFEIRLTKSGIYVNKILIKSSNITFLKNFFSILNNTYISDYEALFYIFNGTRKSKVFDEIVERLINQKNEPEFLIFLSLLNSMGFIDNDLYKKHILNAKEVFDYLYCKNITRIIKNEINNFIEEDTYKLFVIIYYIKLISIIDKNNDTTISGIKSTFGILYKKKEIDQILIFGLPLTNMELKHIQNRDIIVNQLFNNKLFYFMKNMLVYKDIFAENKKEIFRKIHDIMEEIICETLN